MILASLIEAFEKLQDIDEAIDETHPAWQFVQDALGELDDAIAHTMTEEAK